MIDVEHGEVASEAAIETVGQFPALAVDDAGSAVLAYGVEPDRLAIVRTDGDRARALAEVSLPQE